MRSFIFLKFVKYCILYIFIYALIFLPIFLNKGVPVGNDWTVPESSYQLQNWFKSGIYSWSDKSNFLGERVVFNTHLLLGFLGYFLSFFFNMSGALYFKLLLLAGFLIGGISAFTLFIRYGLGKLGSFVGGLVFTLNPVTFNFLLAGWNFVLLSVFLAPLFILFLDEYIDTKKSKYLLSGALIYAFSFIESQSIFYYPIIFLIYFLCLSRHLTFRKLFFILKSLILLVILACLFHLFWLLPLMIYKDPYVSRAVADIDIIRFSLRTSFLNMIRGWGSTFNYPFETAYLKGLIFFSFIFPLIFFINLLIKTQKHVSIFLFYIVLSFFPLIFYSLNKYLRFVPYSNVLRDFNRSFPYLFLAYAYFVARFFTFLSASKMQVQKITVVFLCILLGLHPFVFGYLYSAKENRVGISDKEVDQRLRLYQSEEDIKNFDISKGNQKTLLLNEKALLLPTGSAYIYPNNKKFNGQWASIIDNCIFFSNIVRGVFLTGNSSEAIIFFTNKISEPFEFSSRCGLLNKPFLHTFLASNFKYIIVKNKTINVYRNIDANHVRSCLNKYNGVFSQIFNGEDISIYRILSNNLLPHFYIPKNIIYSPNNIEILPEIVELPGYEIRTGIYLGEQIPSSKSQISNKSQIPKSKIQNKEGSQEILERADEVVVGGKLENQIDEKYFERLENFKKGVSFPYVRWEPGSWEWKLARLKEGYEEWKVRKEPEKLIEKKLFYGGKRISEFEKFADNADKNTLITLIVDGYKKKMNEVIEEIEKLRNWDTGKFEEQVIKVRAYWERHKEKIEEEYRDIGLEKYGDWDRVFEELDEKIKRLEKKFDLENLEYSVDIPREGKYEIFAYNADVAGQITLIVNGREIEMEPGRKGKNEWIRFGEENFKEGINKITLKLPEAENLVGENWRKLEEGATESGEVKLVSQGFFPKVENVVFQPIKDWEAGGLYYLSFEYKTKGGSLGVSVLEDRLVINEINGLTDYDYERKTEKLFEKSIRSRSADKADRNTDNADGWEKYERILRADENTQGAKVYFYTLPDPDAFAEARFRNVKVYKLVQPKIVLRTTADNADKKTRITPRITFVKINPTKYRIKVEGAKEPYTLVFSESFHKGWKLYFNEIPNSKLQIPNKFQNPNSKYLNSNEYGEIIASYFDGEIKEGTHRNTFLEKATFETWGKKPIAEDRHYLVNGYANSWYITPEDVGGKENYELIVEFWPQRLFYVGLGISLITLMGCIVYLIVPLIVRVIKRG
jgi:hypothetical protein